MSPLSWDELELPVLRWVHKTKPDATGYVQTGDLLANADDCEFLPGLSVKQLDGALRTLAEYGLIHGRRDETSDLVFWTKLWVRGNGLRVLGEWPPADAAALNDALVAVLRRVAGEVPDEDAGVVRQAAGIASRITGGAVLDVVKENVQKLGEGLP